MVGGSLITAAAPPEIPDAGVAVPRRAAQGWGSPGHAGVAASVVTTLNEQILLGDEPRTRTPSPSRSTCRSLGAMAIGLCTGVTVLFGVWPQPLIDFANHATLLFLPQVGRRATLGGYGRVTRSPGQNPILPRSGRRGTGGLAVS